MLAEPRARVCNALPPLVLARESSRRIDAHDFLARLMRLTYALTALALPAVGVFALKLVQPGSAPTLARAAAVDHFSEAAIYPRLGERHRDTAQIAILGAAFGRVQL